MAAPTLRQRAHKITYFVTVQLIALIGWIIVQSFFSLSSLGRTNPFPVIMLSRRSGGSRPLSLCLCYSGGSITALSRQFLTWKRQIKD